MAKLNYAIAALIVANIIMGISPPIFKYALFSIPIFTLLFIRFFVAGLLYLPAAVPRFRLIGLGDALLIIGIAILGVTIHVGAIFLALPKTASINIPLIFSAEPVILYFLSVKFLKESPNARILWGSVTALMGVLVIILAPFFVNGGMVEIGKIEGNLLILLGLFASASSVLMKKKVLGRVSPVVVMCLMSLIGSLGFVPGMMRELNTWSFGQLEATGWFVIIFGTLITTVVGHYLLLYGLSKIKAEEVGIFTYIDPVATVLVAVPLLGEIPGADFYLGAVLIFGGIYIAEGRLQWHPIHKLKAQN